MSTTQIPPGTPTQQTPPRRPGGDDLYDSRYWESLYLEDHSTPHLLIQLQDDLDQARRREAFWLSVVVHLVVILAIVNSDRLLRLLPQRAVIVAAPTLDNQKDVTFLEMPPDAQQVTKRPETNIISDKDRNAMSRSPQLNREELKKILDANRAGRPGPSASPEPQPPSPQPGVQAPSPNQGQGNPAPAAPQPSQTQPRLPLPQQQQSPPPNLFAKNMPMTAGSAIQQAAQGAAANRGSYGGDDGNYGLGTGAKATAAMGPMDVLSDTMGVDFGPYLQRVLHDVRINWYNLVPESAKPPIMKKGKVSIEFAIMKDGSVAGMKLIATSGDVALDRGAWGGITASNPFPPLPTEFGGQYLALRFHFYYNPDKGDLQ
ncbi:MAG TPA: TonB C-terminal domain-containing protein [Terriglobales bacterium]